MGIVSTLGIPHTFTAPMARPNYGPTAQARSLHLFTVLLDYANDELDLDLALLERLRPQIQTQWQTEQRLVVRTKLRHLETLCRHTLQPLSRAQIREALHRWGDFLEILSDHRPQVSGSELWHFSINLWHGRRDRTANLRRFVQEWEDRRPVRSKQVTGKRSEPRADADQAADLDPMRDHDREVWRSRCRTSLEAQNYHRLTTNPLTAPDGMRFDHQDLYVPLALVPRPVRDRLQDDADGEEREEDGAIVTLTELLNTTTGRQRWAIVGEAGAGKTTTLQSLATQLLDRGAYPIWVTLADLQGQSLPDYLLQNWLQQATQSLHIPATLQAELSQLLTTGNAWLLLDGVDEMTGDSSRILAQLGRQLRGVLGGVSVVLTCRLHGWEGAKNALDGFTAYCCRRFSLARNGEPDQGGQFIDRWFAAQPERGQQLQTRLHDPQHHTIRDAVGNPLRLALLCRAWSLNEGQFPRSQAQLYAQFVTALYSWQQDRFPTTPAQRQRLNGVLATLAFNAFADSSLGYHLPDPVVQRAFHADPDLLPLALQVGWLDPVGIRAATADPVYRFYHPLFQAYFAAQVIPGAAFWLDPAADYPALNPRWWEVLRLWMGREDMAATEKEEAIAALRSFDDHGAGLYRDRAQGLAALLLAEFPDSEQAADLMGVILDWRFGPTFSATMPQGHSVPRLNLARRVVVQTDRTLAIAHLVEFLNTQTHPFPRWQAAYTLGKSLAPGHPVAVATLCDLLQTAPDAYRRWQFSDSLGRVQPGHPDAIATLTDLLPPEHPPKIRCKAAYSLGKFIPGHPDAIATLETLRDTVQPPGLLSQIRDNLHRLQHGAPPPIPTKSHPSKPPSERAIASITARLHAAPNPTEQRRHASRLARLQPDHPDAIVADAIATLLCLLITPGHPAALYKRLAKDIKSVAQTEHNAQIVGSLKTAIAQLPPSVQRHECDRLLWYCTDALAYHEFLVL